MVVKIRFIEIFLLKNKQGRSAHILEEKYGIPWSRRAAPLFLTFVYCVALFDTTSRALGGVLDPHWRASRAFHPSEDLSELPPLIESVAGQEYHCRRTRSLRDSLPKLLLDR